MSQSTTSSDDKGPLQFTRTQTVQGLPPPTPDPIPEEFELLKLTSSKKVVADAKAMLADYGVRGPVCSLGDDPCLLLLGEPRLFERRGTKLVVSSVLNARAGWQPPAAPTEDGRAADNGLFGNASVAAGFYSNDSLNGPVFVHSYDDGLAFYDNLTACVINGGILFNMHSEGAGQSVYHEVLHLFEGPNAPMVASTYLKEGTVELFSDLFIKRYGKFLPLYEPYAPYVTEVQKLVSLLDPANKMPTKEQYGVIAQAYFGNGDPDAFTKLVPAIYKPTADTAPQTLRLTDVCRTEAARCSCFSGLLSPFKMKEKGSWYQKWVADHGGVPQGGLALQPQPGGRLPLPGGLPQPGGP